LKNTYNGFATACGKQYRILFFFTEKEIVFMPERKTSRRGVGKINSKNTGG
jgi:hypothetical protein